MPLNQGLDGNRDALGSESTVQALDEFVLDEVLIDEFLRAQNDGESDARIAERVDISRTARSRERRPAQSCMTSRATSVVIFSTRSRSLA